MSNVLAALALSSVVERPGGRDLRVSHRFLAHAEGTSGRLHLQMHPSIQAILQAALGTWDEYHGDVASGAHLLEALLDARDQLGTLRPVFPSLHAFGAA